MRGDLLIGVLVDAASENSAINFNNFDTDSTMRAFHEIYNLFFAQPDGGIRTIVSDVGG
jgi:hypothetical protein